jgi:hypothetical protein
VRELVIVISDLYLDSDEIGGSSTAGVTGVLPGFEHAGRFGQGSAIEGGWRAWLAKWLGRADLVNVAPAVVAATGAGVSPDARAADPSTVWIATPVHLIAGLTRLHLDRRSLLRLSAAELAGLASSFQRTFGDTELRLKPMASADFLLQGPATLNGVTTEPARALVDRLEGALPTGSNAAALKRLGAELEMWLHGHPLNDARRQHGELAVTSLWLWGGGRVGSHELHELTAAREDVLAPDRSRQAPAELAFGTDSYLAGLWHLQGGETRPLPDELGGLFGNPRVPRAVVVAEVTPLLDSNPHWTVFEALTELDRRFVSPALTALHDGAVESVVLIANDRELRVRRGDRLKFWRRPQPSIAGLRASALQKR